MSAPRSIQLNVQVEHGRTGPQIFLVLLALLVFVLGVALGQSQLLALALFGCLGLAVTLRWPLPVLILGLLLSVPPVSLGGFSAPDLLQQGGIRVSVLDAIIALTAAIGAWRLWQRRERPAFLWPLALFGVAIGMSWGVGIVLGTTDLSLGLNGIRPFLPYFLYIAACGIVDTRAKLHVVAASLFASVPLAIGYQLWTILTVPLTGETNVVVNGVSVPYQPVPLFDYVLVAICLTFAVLIAVERRPWQPLVIGVLAIGMLGITMRFTRQAYIYVFVGLAIITLLNARHNLWRSIRPLLYLPAIFVPLLLLANLFFAPKFGLSLLEVIAERGGEILSPGTSQTAQIRVETTQKIWRLIGESPLFGTGPNQQLGAQLTDDFFFTDVGFQGTLLFYGAIGLLGVAIVVGTVTLMVLRRALTTQDRQMRAYLLGALGALGGMVINYAFAQDYFTFNICATVLVLIVADRALRFSSDAAA